MFRKRDLFPTPRDWLGALLVTACWSGVSPLAAAADLVEESRDVSGFHSLNASIAGRINLRRAAEEGLVIEAKPETLERLVTEVEDGVLRIHQKAGSNWWRNSGPIRIRVSYRNLNELEMSGSADVTTDALSAGTFRVGISGSSNIEVPVMTTELLEVRVSGSGDLDVRELAADTIEVGVSGSGDVQLGGRTMALTVSVNGSGNVDSTDLEADRAEVVVSGSGDVAVWVLDELDVRISGSGNVEYRGEPEVRRRISGSGDLEAR